MTPTFIPPPPSGWTEFSLGPLTIQAYALALLAGIFFALWLTNRRWLERGGEPEVVSEIGLWAVPFGIIGGRIYHVISSPQPYFGAQGNPVDAIKIWQGGLGIWGAIAFGALGAYIGARRQKVSFTAFADAAAPAILIAQGIGRLGNYMNQELFGGPSTLPWALQVDAAYRPAGYGEFETFHPTFLYEMLWNFAGAILIIWLDKKFDLRGGRTFWLYVCVYVSGRLWIEMVRIDTAVTVGGLRINVWVSIAVLLLGIVMFVRLGRIQAAQSDRVPRHLLAAPGKSGKRDSDEDGSMASSAADDVPADPDDAAAGEKKVK